MEQEEAVLEIFKKANEYIPVFQAMADPERLLILLKLFYAGEQGKNVTELSSNTRLSRPAVSHHLKVLKASGIIESSKVGTQIYYTLKSTAKISFVQDLLEKLQEHLKIIGNNSEKMNDETLDRIIAKAHASLK
uniref:Transcriptional regulator n=1 Tax=uncultured Spirochaetaceae bacterium TaxID=201186 RepID=A0A650F5B9_9SPIO|nr:transcriptional regulator [uncultured Spirochaetaceae bacterium]